MHSRESHSAACLFQVFLWNMSDKHPPPFSCWLHWPQSGLSNSRAVFKRKMAVGSTSFPIFKSLCYVHEIQSKLNRTVHNPVIIIPHVTDILSSLHEFYCSLDYTNTLGRFEIVICPKFFSGQTNSRRGICDLYSIMLPRSQKSLNVASKQS